MEMEAEDKFVPLRKMRRISREATRWRGVSGTSEMANASDQRLQGTWSVWSVLILIQMPKEFSNLKLRMKNMGSASKFIVEDNIGHLVIWSLGHLVI